MNGSAKSHKRLVVSRRAGRCKLGYRMCDGSDDAS
jgi:hypothetical protein